MFKEFKQFAMRGNVIDLAVGVIIGGAFGKIVTSFVDNILMPPISILMGTVDFSNRYINLSGGKFATLADAQAAGATTLNYGLFINAVIDFLIIAFAIFVLIRQINRFQKKEDDKNAVPSSKTCPFCKSEIAIKATRCPACTSQLE
jgi:large conductance mechanosensitive channel